jgi:hypothetical protein
MPGRLGGCVDPRRPVALLESEVGDGCPGVAGRRVVELSRLAGLAQPFQDLGSPFPSVVSQRRQPASFFRAGFD